VSALTGFLNRCRRRISYLFDRSLPSLEDYLAEMPGLDISRPANVDEYMKVLGIRLGIEIDVMRVDTEAHREIETQLGRAPEVAEMLFDAEAGRALICIPPYVGEDDFLYFKSLYHELSHLAAGHPIPVAGADGKLWWPPERLARKPPIADLIRNEVEADLRAEWTLMFGVMGRKIYDRERHFSTF
jgi:hypothetical protein